MGDINPHERRAQALAEITQMQTDLVASNQRVTSLEAKLRDQETTMQREINKQEARAEIAEKSAAMYRAESHLYRGKMIELATTVSNVRKMTDEAEKITATVNAILHGETEEEFADEEATAKELVTSINQMADAHHTAADSNIEDELEKLIRNNEPRLINPTERAAANRHPVQGSN